MAQDPSGHLLQLATSTLQWVHCICPKVNEAWGPDVSCVLDMVDRLDTSSFKIHRLLLSKCTQQLLMVSQFGQHRSHRLDHQHLLWQLHLKNKVWETNHNWICFIYCYYDFNKLYQYAFNIDSVCILFIYLGSYRSKDPITGEASVSREVSISRVSVP